jgi:predicted transcriptional regulator
MDTNKKIALTVRVDRDFKKRLDIMLIHKEKKLQTFMVECLEKELETFEKEQAGEK